MHERMVKSATISEEVEGITLSLKNLLDERFGADARNAQNLTILSASLGMALSTGLVGPGKVTEIGNEFSASAGALFILTFAGSVFFLIRFLFLGWRDIAATRIQRLAIIFTLNEITQAIEANNRIFVDRRSCKEK